MRTIQSLFISLLVLSLTACAAGGLSLSESCSLLSQQQATSRQAENSRQIADTLERSMAAAKSSLAQSRAYQNGQCVMVKQQALPPKPEVLSENQMYFQAAASSVDLAMRRFSSQEVTEALMAVRMDSFLKAYAMWKQTKPESCALISPSQIDNWMCDTVFRLGGRQGVSSCIQDLVRSYAAQAMQSCSAPLTAWQETVSNIQAEPQRLVSECQHNLETIADAERRIPQLRMQESLNREENQKLTATLNATQRGKPLSQAACAASR